MFDVFFFFWNCLCLSNAMCSTSLRSVEKLLFLWLVFTEEFTLSVICVCNVMILSYKPKILLCLWSFEGKINCTYARWQLLSFSNKNKNNSRQTPYLQQSRRNALSLTFDLISPSIWGIRQHSNTLLDLGHLNSLYDLGFILRKEWTLSILSCC